MSLLNRLVNLWRSRSLDADFDDELRFHFEMRVERNLRAGMSRDEAEREARRHLGDTRRVKEGMREARMLMGLDALARDLRYGVRLLRRQPGTAMLAVLTLSLGIGANAVIFSLVHALLLRPLPFPDADRLVALNDHFRGGESGGTGPTVPELLDVRARTRLLDGVSFYDLRDAQINGGSEPVRALSARVEGSFLTVLGVQPALGRRFVESDNLPGRDRVVILTDGFWQRNFGGDASIIGRSIVVNGAPYAVVGVLPPAFHFDYRSPEPIELYVPFTMSAAYTSREAEFTNVRRVFGVGRLKPDVSLAQAEPATRRSRSAGRRHWHRSHRRGIHRPGGARHDGGLRVPSGAAVLAGPDAERSDNTREPHTNAPGDGGGGSRHVGGAARIGRRRGASVDRSSARAVRVLGGPRHGRAPAGNTAIGGRRHHHRRSLPAVSRSHRGRARRRRGSVRRRAAARCSRCGVLDHRTLRRCATLSQQRASWRIVSPGYFAVLGIPVRAGRSFTRDDTAARPRVAIVNEEFVRGFWPDQSPLGQQIRSGVGPRDAVTTVVGVVGDVRPPLQTGLVPQIYVSYLQQSEPNITLLVRSAAAATVSPQAIKQAVWSVAPDQPLFNIRPMHEVIAQPLAQPRLIAQFLGGFALLALLMSTLGVYMIVSYLTSRRAREIALRRAIGAAPLDIFRLLAGQTVGWTLAGLILGIAGAIAASGALRAILASLTALDAGTVSAIAAFYLIVVAIAVCVPAVKAMRADPAMLLRAE